MKIEQGAHVAAPQSAFCYEVVFGSRFSFFCRSSFCCLSFFCFLALDLSFFPPLSPTVCLPSVISCELAALTANVPSLRPASARLPQRRGFAPFYIGQKCHRRVSTVKQGRSGLGLEAQVAAVEAYANQNDADIVATYTEVESGKKADRPKLHEAIGHVVESEGPWSQPGFR